MMKARLHKRAHFCIFFCTALGVERNQDEQFDCWVRNEMSAATRRKKQPCRSKAVF